MVESDKRQKLSRLTRVHAPRQYVKCYDSEDTSEWEQFDPLTEHCEPNRVGDGTTCFGDGLVRPHESIQAALHKPSLPPL